MRRNELFSILRFLLVLCIVGYHFAPAGLREWIWIFSSGQTCVTFFFVLSGFVTHSSARIRWKGAGGFYWKKLLALGPLYYFTFLVCIAIEIRNSRFPIPVIAADLAMVQAWIPGQQMGLNAPAWFMSALVFCLLLYPLLKMATAGRTARFYLILAGTVWLIVQGVTISLAAIQLHPVPLYWMYFPLFHLASFVVGIATCEWHLQRVESTADKATLIPLVASIAVLLFCVKGIGSLPDILRQAAYTSLFALPFAWVIVSVARLPTNIVDAVDRPWIRLLGQLAFPVYLLQVPVFKVFDRLIIQSGIGIMTIPLFVAYLALLFVPSVLWITMAEPLLLAKLRLRRA